MTIDWQWSEVDHLEAQQKYKAACHLMYDTWIQEPKGLKVFLRLSFSCWYVTNEYKVLKDTDVKIEELSNFEVLLKELLNFGLREFKNEPDFLWLFGYMISLFPESFDEEMDEKIGKDMLENAANRRPEDPIIQLLHFSNVIDLIRHPSYKELCEKVSYMLPTKFVGEGELQRYFREVLNRVDF